MHFTTFIKQKVTFDTPYRISLLFEKIGVGLSFNLRFCYIRFSDGASKFKFNCLINCQWLLNFQLSITFSNVGGAWIGFSDATTEGTFEWTIPYKDGTSKKFTKWNNNEPNNNNNEDCAVLSKDGVWNDISCSQTRTFFCEFSKPWFISNIDIVKLISCRF